MGAEPSDSRNVVFAMVASFVFLFVILGVVVAIDRRGQGLLAENANPNEELTVDSVFDIPDEQPTPDPGPAGLNKGGGGGSKPKFERPQGGGGGVRFDDIVDGCLGTWLTPLSEVPRCPWPSW